MLEEKLAVSVKIQSLVQDSAAYDMIKDQMRLINVASIQ